MRENELQAVFNEDLPKLLRSIGQLEEIENGNILCRYCRIPITITNIQFMIPIGNNKIEYICNKNDCVEQYLEQQQGGE